MYDAMCAQPFDPNRNYKLGEGEIWWLTPKIDGIRCIIAPAQTSKSKKADGDQPQRVFGRSGKHIPNRQIRKILGDDLVPNGLDGELIAGFDNDIFKPDCYKRIASFYSNLDAYSDNWSYQVFNFRGDCSPEYLALPLEQRLRDAAQLVSQLPEHLQRHIRVMPHYGLSNIAEAYEKVQAWVELGGEGGMLTTNKAPYVCKRASFTKPWALKLKAHEDAEFRIVGYEEEVYRGTKTISAELLGTAKQDVAGSLRLVPIEGLSPACFKAEFGCGTGFDQATRRDIVTNWETKYKGKIAKIKYQGCGSDLRPRTPVWQGLRDEVDCPEPEA